MRDDYVLLEGTGGASVFRPQLAAAAFDFMENGSFFGKIVIRL